MKRIGKDYHNSIISEVCRFYGVNYSDLRMNDRNRLHKFVIIRQLIMVFCCKFEYLTTVDAGNIFNKNHSTVIHAQKTVNNLYFTDLSFRNSMNEMNQNIIAKFIGIDLEIENPINEPEILICL